MVALPAPTLQACRPTASLRGTLGALCPLEPSCGNWVFIRTVWSLGPGPVLPRNRERHSLGQNPVLGSWVQAHFTANTRAPPKAAPPRALGLVRCCCCSEILNHPVHLSAPSPRSSAVSALNPCGGRPIPRHSGLLLGSVLFLVWAALLCRLLLSALPFVFRLSVPGELGVSWASPLPGH